MKKAKMKLNQLKVDSFVTKDRSNIKGGRAKASNTVGEATVFVDEYGCILSCVDVEA